MPALAPPCTVLVTGASGFCAIWIIRTLLESGYSVCGTVRSPLKATFLDNLFKEHGGRYRSTIVADIAKAGAFDEALKGDIAGVIHVAGVARFMNDVMSPNHDGVVNLLNSLLDHGKHVKRFIYMSSAQALLGKPLTHVYTEDDWNDAAVARVEELGKNADGQSIYAASKVLSERAIIDFAAQHGDEIDWDCVRLVPAFIFGPIIHDCKHLDELNLSTALMLQYLTTIRENGTEGAYASDYVDVRDVADAFVSALQTDEAGGERFILDSGAFTFQNLYDAVHKVSAGMLSVPQGDPDAPKFSFPGPFCNSEKARNVLKLKPFRSLGECACDTLTSLKEKGLLT